MARLKVKLPARATIDNASAAHWAFLDHFADGQLAERPLLQPTALVHEAYLRLVGSKESRSFRDRGHFFTAAAAMRRILIDNVRRKKAQKRGGGRQRQQLAAVAAPEDDQELLALDAALQKLAAKDPQKAKLVELRYFAGLTGEQAAEVLGVSPTTADPPSAGDPGAADR